MPEGKTGRGGCAPPPPPVIEETYEQRTRRRVIRNNSNPVEAYLNARALTMREDVGFMESGMFALTAFLRTVTWLDNQKPYEWENERYMKSAQSQAELYPVIRDQPAQNDGPTGMQNPHWDAELTNCPPDPDVDYTEVTDGPDGVDEGRIVHIHEALAAKKGVPVERVREQYQRQAEKRMETFKQLLEAQRKRRQARRATMDPDAFEQRMWYETRYLHYGFVGCFRNDVFKLCLRTYIKQHEKEWTEENRPPTINSHPHHLSYRVAFETHPLVMQEMGVRPEIADQVPVPYPWYQWTRKYRRLHFEKQGEADEFGRLLSEFHRLDDPDYYEVALGSRRVEDMDPDTMIPDPHYLMLHWAPIPMLNNKKYREELRAVKDKIRKNEEEAKAKLASKPECLVPASRQPKAAVGTMPHLPENKRGNVAADITPAKRFKATNSTK